MASDDFIGLITGFQFKGQMHQHAVGNRHLRDIHRHDGHQFRVLQQQ